MSLQISKDLELPLSAVTSTIVVYGGKGMGKTNLLGVLAEEFKANKQRFAVIDPVGVSWGLRHSASGKGPGIEVLTLGGMHGDLPIEPTAGVVVADLVVDEDVDVVVDISRFTSGKMWSVGDQVRFVTDFFVRLYERQGERRRPIHILVDEAGRFVPQTIPSGAIEIAKCMGAIERCVELGRNVGIGISLITQRSARMNKSVSELADCMIAFRTVGPRSIDAIIDWFGEHVPREHQKALLEQLRSLPVGTALVVSPGWLNYEGQATIRKKRTFDSSATPTADSQEATGKGARPDLSKYQQRMAEYVEKVKADDPRELRRRIAELQQKSVQYEAHINDLQLALAEQPAEKIVERVEVPVLEDAQVERLTQQCDRLVLAGNSIAEFGRQIAGIGMDVVSALGKAQQAPAPPSAPTPIARAPKPAPVAKPAQNIPKSIPADVPAGDITRPQQAILSALAEFEALSLREVAKSNVAVFADQSPSSSGFTNNLGRLRSVGLIEYPRGGFVALTEQGRRVAVMRGHFQSLEALHDAWYSKLPNPRANILRVLVQAYPHGMAKDDLAREAGQSPTSSGYTNNLGALRSLGLIDYPQSGYAVATALLFPEGLAA